MATHLTKLVSAVKESSTMLDLALSRAQELVAEDYKSSLSTPSAYQLSQVFPVPSQNIRMLQIEKLVLGEGDPHSRLVSVFQTVHDIVDACFLLICGHANDQTDVYLGMTARENTVMAFTALQDNFRGNFPGTTLLSQDGPAIECMLNAVCSPTEPAPAISLVSMVPSRRNMVDSSQDSLDLQGLDTFIDAMRGKEYTAVLLAVPVDTSAVARRRHTLEALASSISPLESINYQYGKNMTVSTQHSINMSIADSINQSVADAYSTSSTTSSGHSSGSSSHSDSHFSSLGFGFGSQSGTFSSRAVTDGTTHTQTTGTGQTSTLAEGMTDGLNLGMSEGWSRDYRNHAISSILKEIDRQLRRIEQCDSYGAWDTCSYFVSRSPAVVRIAAANFQALVCGEDSAGSINVWLPWSQNAQHVLQHIRAFRIPVFTRQGQRCQAGTMISGSELPILMNLPRRPVYGMPVTTMASFGRQVYTLRSDDPAVNPSHPKHSQILIATGYHMGEEEPGNVIALDYNMFSSHVLFTGTTGVGKSTLIAMLLSAISQKGIHFMLIEPAKGEYKHLLGNVSDLQVFTSDPQLCRLLRINPFSFLPGIQLLAHIDRLIDIFSVCWPLYAAQPAVLRECIEEAYIQCGWDLNSSEYVRPGFPQFPTFSTLLEVLPAVIDRSHFVGEARGTYEGALMARLGMLTRGLYGQILNGVGGVSDEELFNANVIVDLSAAGSQETISLIMGILLIRLREYRIVKGQANNAPLQHVMVLEEAHNILPRVQSQGVEGGETVAGKSVQMLVQCIAEMRSYGQGFFIADQSPSAIDIAGIRNTATKIVMQLPEEADQQTIAKSLSLNERQTRELSRLPRRVAVAYQSTWLEPVLLKIGDIRRAPKNTYNPHVDRASREELRSARGALARLILPMARTGILDRRQLLDPHNALFPRVALNASKQRDLAAICRYYADWYACEGPFSEEEDQDIRSSFFGAFLTSLLDCDLLLRMVPPPGKASSENGQHNGLFHARCMTWQRKARQIIDHYASGLSLQEKDALLTLLLSCKKAPDHAAVLEELHKAP